MIVIDTAPVCFIFYGNTTVPAQSVNVLKLRLLWCSLVRFKAVFKRLIYHPLIFFKKYLLFWTLLRFIHKKMCGIKTESKDKEFSSTRQKIFSFARYQLVCFKRPLKMKNTAWSKEKMPIHITVEWRSIRILRCKC